MTKGDRIKDILWYGNKLYQSRPKKVPFFLILQGFTALLSYLTVFLKIRENCQLFANFLLTKKGRPEGRPKKRNKK